MRSIVLLAAALLARCITAVPVAHSKMTRATPADVPSEYMEGFKNPTVKPSVGGQAICISGMVDVKASANFILYNIQQPTNQSQVIELLLETVQVNSTLAKQVFESESVVAGTYGIYSSICYPSATGKISNTTIQFLIHGAGFDQSYWNVAPGYSYIDVAAEQGYTTFLYDRIGVGHSDHPDPIQIVQQPVQVEIAHQLIQSLRSGTFAGHAFEHVVGVGHSLGSFQLEGITAQYPADVDAAVLTGFSPDASGMPIAFASLDLSIASLNQPYRFADLPTGYLTSNSIEGTQSFFFRAPGFDPAMLAFGDSVKQTIAIGEFLGLGGGSGATNFTGPIDVVNGEFDLPNCHGNCLVPYNKAAAVKDVLYPAASNGSDWYIAPNTGHGLNFHYSAQAAYEHIQNFIKKNGF